MRDWLIDPPIIDGEIQYESAGPHLDDHISYQELKFQENVDKSRGVHILKSWILIVLGMNGVAVAQNGPILDHNEATGSRKVSRYLPDLRDTI